MRLLHLISAIRSSNPQRLLTLARVYTRAGYAAGFSRGSQVLVDKLRIGAARKTVLAMAR